MSDYGTIVNCWIATVGDELAANVSIGGSTLTVVNPGDFAEGGGIVRIDGTEIVAYTACDDDTGVITLTTTLTAAHTAGDRVDGYPVGQEKWAQVIVDDDVEAITVRVPQALWDRIPEGTREGVGESIVFTEDDQDPEEFVVTDLLGVIPLVDASFLDPESTIPTGAITDGEAPASSPIPTVVGVPRLLIAKVAGVVNHDAVSYEWHISTSSAGTPTLGDATTHHADAATMAAFETDAAGDALLYETDYFIGTFAYDADGAASFSGWSTAARLDPNGTADIAVGAITAANIEAVLILASTIKTSESGRRIEFDGTTGVFGVYDSDDTPLVYFPTDGSDLEINAKLRTGDIVVQGGLSLQGTTNAFAKNSSATLEAKTNDPPTVPTLATGWPSLAFNVGGLTSPANRHGLFWYSSLWWTGYSFFNSSFVQAYDPVTGLSSGSAKTLPFGYDPTGGITHMTIGGNLRWVVLCQDIGSGGDWVAVIYNDSWVYQSEWTAGFLSSAASAHISNDGTQVLIVQRDTGDTYTVFSRNASTGAAVGTTSCTTGTGSADAVAGYYYGSADYGAARHTIVTATALGISYTTRAYPFNTSGTLQSGERFYTATAEAAGITYDGTNFFSLSTVTPSIYKHGNLSKAAGSTTYLVPYTWYDSDATGGTHETQMSAQGSKSVPCRQCLTVTAPPIPDQGGTDDADSVKIYAGTVAGRTSQWLQATPAAGTRTFTITNLVTSGTNPPAANDFPDASAFEIKNYLGNPLLAGDDLPLTDYTPTVTGGGGNPTVTNSTLVGRYKLTQGWCEGYFHITVGSNWTAAPGSGAYEVALPIASLRQFLSFCGTFRDVSAGNSYDLHGEIFDAALNKAILRLEPTTAGNQRRNLTSVIPVTIGTGDIITVQYAYEV